MSWIREHYHEVNASTHEEFSLKLFKQEIKQREERKTNLLLKSATLPNKYGKPFDWKDIELSQGITQTDLLNGVFIERKENLIFYGGVGVGKIYLSTLIGLNVIRKYGKKVKFYTAASLVNQLLEANEKGTLNKIFKQIGKLDLLILDELGYIPFHKQGAELLFQVISLCY
uniref:ATP-binding protein n=1 Tax=Neobacillus fumarioli TaxID=105229 RepID=UPI000AF6F143